MKSASKISVATTSSDTVFKVTRKVFDADTGEAKDDVEQSIPMEFVDSRLAAITAEKEDLEQFKTDAEAL